jgi:putative phosphoesterase
MQIAILSDTHSRYHTVETALGLLQARGINQVIHCGDIDDSETVWLFQGFTAHFVFGNCDTDRASLRQAIHGIGETLHEPFGHLELNGVKIAFLHGDDQRLLHDVEHSGHFDFLFYGHTHQAREHRVGPTRVINPGALHRARPKTFVVLDLGTGDVESVTVDP